MVNLTKVNTGKKEKKKCVKYCNFLHMFAEDKVQANWQNMPYIDFF